MTNGREGQTATLLPNGEVLLIGGQGPQTDPAYPYGVIPIATSDVYAPGADRWSTVARMSGPRIELTSTLLRNGTVLVMGNAVPGTSRAEVYDPTRNLWSNIDQLTQRDEVKFVITDRADYEWAIEVMGRFGLARRVKAVLMSAVHEQPSNDEVEGCPGLSLRDLAEWMLADRLPPNVRMQTQLHKLIWDPQTRGV